MTTTTEGYRSASGTVADLDDRGHQVLIRIPHESFDGYRTDFARHAFADSFARQLPEFKREHRLHVGECSRAQSLDTHNEIVADFDQTPVAERTFNDVRDGRLRGYSFHYFNAHERIPHPVHAGGIRYLRADVDEVSAVSRPAIPGTVTAGLRSMPDVADERLAVFARALEHVNRHRTKNAVGQSDTGHRSQLLDAAYAYPELYIDYVRTHADSVLDDAVEQRYRLFEMQRDGLLPKSPEYRLGEIFRRHQPNERNRRCLETQ